MVMKNIKNEIEYVEALKRFHELFFAKKGTQEGQEAELLALVIEKYESENYKIEEPSFFEYFKYKIVKMVNNFKYFVTSIFVESAKRK